MKETGIPEATVRDIIGHESKAVSANYTHVDEAAKHSALEKYSKLLYPLPANNERGMQRRIAGELRAPASDDQFSGLYGIVIPGTLHDSPYVLDGLLEHQTRIAASATHDGLGRTSYLGSSGS